MISKCQRHIPTPVTGHSLWNGIAAVLLEPIIFILERCLGIVQPSLSVILLYENDTASERRLT